MRRKLLTCLTACVMCLLAFTAGVMAYDTSDLTIPSSAEAIVYGQSGAGRNLTAYRFGTGKNVMVLGFSIHGFEDNWTRDGGALVYTAGQLMQQLDKNMSLVNDYGWSIYVLPCMNPDGLIDGYSHNGPGRCTTTYLSGGSLVKGTGIDMNRSFPTRWTRYTGSRNFNGYAPLASQESAALAKFVQSVKGAGNNICIDAHGWYSQIITSNGTGSKLYQVFKSAFPGNSWANCNNAPGYFTAYTAQLGYASCLFEFPDGLTSLAGFQKSGYCERFNGCILELAKSYGVYDPHASACPARSFTDVNRSSWSWYHDSLDYVMEKGIINGMSATSFAPDRPMSRAQLVKTLWAMAGSPDVELPPVKPDPAPEPVEPEQPEDTKTPEPSEGTDEPEDDKASSDDGSASTGTQPPAASEPPQEETPEEPAQYQFTDVPENAWFTKAVYWAQQNGVVEGYPDGTFLPDRDVTRQEMAAVLYRYAQKHGEDVSARAQLSAYQDADQVASWAKDAMGWVCGKNIIRGVTDTSLSPEGNATRSQVATILARYLRGDTQTSRTLEAGPLPEMEPIFYDDGPDLNGN